MATKDNKLSKHKDVEVEEVLTSSEVTTTLSIKASIRAHKGHFTREKKLMIEAMAGVDVDSETIRNLTKNLQERIAIIGELSDNLTTIDDSEEENMSRTMDELTSQYGIVVREGATAMARSSARSTIHSATGSLGDRPNQFRVASDLRPPVITMEYTPPEMRSWLDKFKSYYKTSHMELLHVEEQKSFFMGRMEGEILATIKRRIVGCVNIEECYEQLEFRFLEIHPLFGRRLTWKQLQNQKKPSQRLADFYSIMRGVGDEAELDQMTVDDQYMYGLIMACRNESELFLKLLEIIEPTLEKVLSVAQGFEASRELREQAIPKGAGTISAISDGRCFNCGSYNHFQDACPILGLTCHICHQPGHLARNCSSNRSDSRERGKSRSNSRDRGRERWRRPTTPIKRRDRTPSTARISFVKEALRDISRKITTTATPTTVVRCWFPGDKKVVELMAVLDTGATRTVFPMRNLPPGVALGPSTTKLRAANGTTMSNNGLVELTLAMKKGKPTTISALVSSDLDGPMLVGFADLVALDVLPPDFPCIRGVTDTETFAFVDTVEQVKRDFPDVLVNDLGEASGCMKGPKMTIHLDPNIDIKPCHITTARQTPIHLKEMSDDLVKELKIAKVLSSCNVPTKWISPAHFVEKPGGKKVRMVTDYRQLNKAVQRPVRPFSSPQDLIRQIRPDSRWFAKMDAVHGYFQVPLDSESSLLTAFLLPSGKYVYNVAPMGLNASSDEFNERSDRAVQHLEYLMKIVDDMMAQAPTRGLIFIRLREVLECCRNAGIKLSLDKLQVGQCMKFAGFIVNQDGVTQDPDKLASLSRFPTPVNITELRSFLGLSNQLGHFLPDLAHATVKMRELLKKKNAFLWLDEHDKEFQKAKDLLCSPAVVKPFDPVLKTEILTDASRLHGLGYALIQRDRMSNPRLIQCGSCSLTTAQQNYATVELECSAIQWAINKCYFYLRGLPGFKVITDHRPLVGIFDKPLSSLANARLQRMRENLVAYSFTVEWSAGKTHLIADALSRAPYFPAEEESDIVVRSVVNSKDPALRLVIDNVDQEYRELRHRVQSGRPLSDRLGHFKALFDTLRVEDGILLSGDCLLIPRPARPRVLDLLHASHSGMNKTLTLAKQLYVWPGLPNDVKNRIAGCSSCLMYLPSQSNQPILSDSASFPMDKVSVDLFELENRHYIILVDRFSGYPFVHRLASLTTSAICEVLIMWFYEYGFPKHLKGDNGPQFRDQFDSFCRDFNIMNETSSPYNPRSNGLAEAAVKSVKNLMKKVGSNQKTFREALFAWRLTPRSDGFSPFFGFFGRNPRSLLPDVRDPPLVSKEFAEAREKTRNDSVMAAGGKNLVPLSVGDSVAFQSPTSKTWFPDGIIDKVLPGGRSYVVKTSSGSYRRNRVFLRPRSKSLRTTNDISSPHHFPNHNPKADDGVNMRETGDGGERNGTKAANMTRDSSKPWQPRRSERIQNKIKNQYKKLRFHEDYLVK